MLEPSIGRRSFFFYSLAYYGALGLTIAIGLYGLHLLVLPVFLYCGVRPRLHDLGHGGIWTLLVFVPFANFVMLILLLVKEGEVPSALDLNRAIYGVEQPRAVWECPGCHESNPNTTYVCSHCGSSLM